MGDNKVVTLSLVALLVAVTAGAFAADKPISVIRVESSRIVETTAGQTGAGVPIKNVSLSYEVSLEDLDLATATGLAAAEKRIQNAATQACEELAKKYPESTPESAQCVPRAIRKPMAALHAGAPPKAK